MCIPLSYLGKVTHTQKKRSIHLNFQRFKHYYSHTQRRTGVLLSKEQQGKITNLHALRRSGFIPRSELRICIINRTFFVHHNYCNRLSLTVESSERQQAEEAELECVFYVGSSGGGGGEGGGRGSGDGGMAFGEREAHKRVTSKREADRQLSAKDTPRPIDTLHCADRL